MKKILTGVSAAAVMMAGASYADTTLKLVEVITSPERTQVLQGIVDQYEAANPDVSVEIISLPWGQAFEKLATMVAGGDIPDVVEMPEIWQALYVGSDQLVSLTDHVANWDHGATLTDQAVEMGSLSGDLYTIPYGFYLRAMFYNKKLLAQAGVDSPPTTMEEFMAASSAVSKLDGKSGYCLRGGPGSTNAWIMFASAMNGTSEFFTPEGQSRINEPGSVAGIQLMIDMYQNGNAPRDSVNWGFNEVVAGFYSGTCAFLDQDPDALIAISERMPAEDFAVIPMPVGPSGQAFPTTGFAGWSIFKSTEHEAEAFDLVAALSSPEANSTWAKAIGVIPIHKGADQEEFFKTEQFQGWFETLNGEAYLPTMMPAYLDQWGYFSSSVLLESSQEALLGQRTAQDVADEWAEFLTEEYAKWQVNQ